MSLFERYLSLGHGIGQEEKLSIYKFLLLTKESSYKEDARALLKDGELVKYFANGEIKYSFSNGVVSYITREKSSQDFTSTVREIRVGHFKSLALAKIERFFAQSEVDVMSNFPLSDGSVQEEGGFEITVSPFYDLNYYSKGNGKFLGLIEKIRHKDDELLQQLLAS